MSGQVTRARLLILDKEEATLCRVDGSGVWYFSAYCSTQMTRPKVGDEVEVAEEKSPSGRWKKTVIPPNRYTLLAPGA